MHHVAKTLKNHPWAMALTKGNRGSPWKPLRHNDIRPGSLWLCLCLRSDDSLMILLLSRFGVWAVLTSTWKMHENA